MLRKIGVGLLAYLTASAVALTIHRWPDFDGHAHVPFSGFPEFLVWSPTAPVFLAWDLPDSSPAFVAFMVFFGASLWLFLRK